MGERRKQELLQKLDEIRQLALKARLPDIANEASLAKANIEGLLVQKVERRVSK